ncbi:Na+/H+ antiporter subunit B [Schleiferia thermophila]|jgi:multicomponent Na+:H+ antiporter subunit B|uniref:Multisubunit sodium/proton antiporter MrpB subunit n=1 Tax=Schleiferia thermophila TaxID=884107 RepID=A0A368ZW23_9FLAO|nr:Na+/H+ antiporter subunit B [Schleiferia thermophila]KFD39125.1 cation:proton antiporter [Schleiferia thermophila str. Yellowstone]PMB37504.1 Na(+)/H(+) antiporter subunit B [Fischerella thermalis CCMEE 5319]RCX01212.1 multisubunit sodium/proton antiporter MrpB subunit [Schleiferia thermophila]GCD80539.1 Na(+)/H(+) antiporter subunit B [Schleiferia thermophila]
MKSIILKKASDYLLPLLLLFSVFILLRGHYLPGGGFVGGLIASIAFVLHSFANGLNETKHLLRIHPGFLMPLGLSVSLLSGLYPMVIKKEPFMAAQWMKEPLDVIGLVGTPLFFDIGVYLVVVGVSLTIIFTLAEVA